MVLFSLIGGSEAAAYVWYALIGLYLLLPAYVVFGGWRGLADRQQIRLLWFLVLPTATFVILWLCGRVIWMILWWLQLGDDAQYAQYGSWTSAIAALTVSATLLVRIATGRATGRYVRINSWGVALIAGLFCAQLVLEFTHGIYGWSARGAAESQLAKVRLENHQFVDPNAPRRIVEEPIPNSDEHAVQNKRFVLCSGNSPIHEVRVAPYGWFWWTLGSSVPVIPATDMDWAVAHWETDRNEATERLNAVIKNYPNSDASRWASKTLKRLRERGGAPGWTSEMMRRLQVEARKRRAQSTNTNRP